MTNEPKWTKDPMTIRPTGFGNTKVFLGDSIIAYFFKPHELGDGGENARLFVAAQDLYLALEIARQRLRTAAEFAGYDDDVAEASVEYIDKALAKARGEI